MVNSILREHSSIIVILNESRGRGVEVKNLYQHSSVESQSFGVIDPSPAEKRRDQGDIWEDGQNISDEQSTISVILRIPAFFVGRRRIWTKDDHPESF